MSKRHLCACPPLSREALLAIHKACNRFEDAWPTPQRLTIEEIVEELETTERDRFVESLIRSEIELRSLSPREDIVQEFLGRFPDHPNAVARAFVSIDEISQLDRDSTSPEKNHPSEPETQKLGTQDIRQPELPKMLGNYQIVDEYARGGMGVVFRARDVRLDRIVAIKVVRSGHLASESEIARFRTEAQAIAALDHPNIVPVFEAGEASGYHYFSMPLIEGGNLADRIRDQPMDATEAARITDLVARAVHYAHEHGVIHRDLKPRNILFHTSGSPRVTDFGLAKLVASAPEKELTERDLTLTGQAVGTPAYMAPEQALGKPTKLSDVYSLGAVLYALMTGRPPFQASSSLELLRQVLEIEPVEPRRLNPTIPRDLETIAMKCLSKHEGARYGSALLLAEDLTRFLQGKPIVARPVSPLGRLQRWVTRQPLVAGLLALVLATLSIGLATSLLFYRQSRNQEFLTQKNLEVAADAVKHYLTEVASSPELKEKGLETLRKDLLQSAQGFFEQLESQSEESNLRTEIIDNQNQLALIRRELGDFGKADEIYQQMTANLDKMFALQPDDSLLRQKAAVLQERAKLASDGRENLHQQSVAIRRTIYQNSQRPADRVWLGSSLAELGVFLATLDRAADESKVFEEVEEICEQVIAGPVQALTLADRVQLLEVMDHLALNRQRHGELARAEKWFLAESTFIDEQFRTESKSSSISSLYAKIHRNLGMVCAMQQRFDQAVPYFQIADAEYASLTESHPLVLEFADGRAVTLFNHGTMEAMRRNWTVAESLIEKALPIQNKLVAKQPDHLNYHIGLTHFYRTLAIINSQQGETDTAIQYHRLGIQEQDIAGQLAPDDLNLAFLSASQKGTLAEIYRNQQQYPLAIETYEAAIEQLRKLIDKNRSVVNHLRAAGMYLHSLAMIHAGMKEYGKAKESELESHKWYLELVERTPEAVDTQVQLANTHSGLGMILLEQGSLAEAEKEVSEALTRLEGVIDAKKGEPLFGSEFGYALYIHGRIMYAKEDWQTAVASFDRSIEKFQPEWEKVSTQDKKSTVRIRELLCDAYRDRAKALYQLGEKASALEDCQSGLALDTGSHADELRKVIEWIEDMP